VSPIHRLDLGYASKARRWRGRHRLRM